MAAPGGLTGLGQAPSAARPRKGGKAPSAAFEGFFTMNSLELALTGWCPLSPADAQTTQLLVEPPWMLAVLWDRVILTCQGSGTTGATTWYKDGQSWWLKGPNNFRVTKSGTYQCDRPGSGLSLPLVS
ncbi:hypothetical protein HGM15179_019933 [Zosterops borbonicus]|uniref:Ig-like domain-containing protein n=1 Tax=Zosterops borbonicus TaxID=364589 RepID=A0A8K1D8F3_9PASS|nr:hypothetical protein HGM15179_019933 [Zosterops borbonicus]